MSRGISKQQKQILAMLRTKKGGPYFTTDEVISELCFDYRLWLLGQGAEWDWSHRPRSQQRSRPFEAKRVSIHRALMNLERRGLVISGFWGHSRHWAVPKRVPVKERRWVSRISEGRIYHREAWQWGWFIRRLPEDLRIRYKCGILRDDDIKELERRRIDYYRTKILPGKFGKFNETIVD